MTWHQNLEAATDMRVRSWESEVAHRKLLAQLPARASSWGRWPAAKNSLIRSLLSLAALFLVAQLAF